MLTNHPNAAPVTSDEDDDSEDDDEADKTPFTYIITLTNRDDSSISLNKIHDNLPPGLKFQCGGTSTLIFPDGITQQTVAPEPDEGQTGCPLDRHLL